MEIEICSGFDGGISFCLTTQSHKHTQTYTQRERERESEVSQTPVSEMSEKINFIIRPRRWWGITFWQFL
jgi:hypothetical protein